ncbi:MAG: hypothetical protein MJ106_06720, partial [Lentisphaeria bacterium]|nr:hypothetical protein [Lentisphaeria bacterium]
PPVSFFVYWSKASAVIAYKTQKASAEICRHVFASYYDYHAFIIKETPSASTLAFSTQSR